jgi:hypothetical protein
LLTSGSFLPAMSTKEIVTELLDRLPENVSLLEVARELEFIAAVNEGLESYEREGGVSAEVVRNEISAWAKGNTR